MATSWGRIRLTRIAAGASLSALAACGGAGRGVSSTPTPVSAAPAPTPSVVPPPAPTPAPSPASTASSLNYDTPVYRAAVGAVSMNALASYQRGATGAGIGIGVIDSGIDLTNAQFATRISSASQDVAGTRGIADESGHGTAVAFTAAGGRNGAGSQGVAFDATLIVERADAPGSCATAAGSGDKSSCAFPTDAIARGVDAARTAGARVINMSLGGVGMSADLTAAVGRATAAGIVVVIAAGNEGSDNPDSFTAVANDTGNARNQVIVAGSVSTSDGMSAFSDRAGSEASHFLTAVGENVRAPNNGNVDYLWSGTSFAAPQISGAVALLAQAFPNLTGAQIVDLLFRTARDAGAPGVDAIYGNGVIDLTRAFQPVGGTSLAGSTTLVPSGAGTVLSAAMGDASSASLGAVVLDGYGRAFAIDLAQTLSHGAPSPVLAPMLAGTSRNVALAAGGMTASLTLAPRRDVTSGDGETNRVVAGTLTQRLTASTSFAIGMRQGSDALAAQLAGEASPAFLVARDDAMGFTSDVRGSSALRRQAGAWGIVAGMDHGDVLSPRLAPTVNTGGWRRSGYDRMSLGVDRRLGALSAAITASRLAEQNTVLGSRFDASLGGARATSWFGEARARIALGEGWTLGGSIRRGWTRAIVQGDIRGAGRLQSGAFAADLRKQGPRDSFGLCLSQPLRVASGGVDLTLPTGWDYAASSVSEWTTQRIDLAPRGRELDVEARYARRLLWGDVAANLFWRRDPGNIAALPADYGLALRYSVGW